MEMLEPIRISPLEGVAQKRCRRFARLLPGETRWRCAGMLALEFAPERGERR